MLHFLLFFGILVGARTALMASSKTVFNPYTIEVKNFIMLQHVEQMAIHIFQ